MAEQTILIVDLFAGIGGLRTGVLQGLKDVGLKGEVVYTSEIKKAAVTTLTDNHPGELVSGDITKVDAKSIPDHDLLLAGFPCQAFSYAGARRGFSDEVKGTLFFDVLRVLKEKRPKRFILENVEGLINHDADPEKPKGSHGRTLSTILAALEAEGYKVDWRLLVGTDFGVPQHRKRVFITGSLDSTPDLSTLKTVERTPVFSDIMEVGKKETDAKVLAFETLLKKEYPDLSVLEGKIFRDKRGGDNNIHSWNINYKGQTTDDERKLLEVLAVESKRRAWSITKGVKWREGMSLSESEISTFFTPSTSANLKSMLDNLSKLGYLREESAAIIGSPTEWRILSGKLSMPVGSILKPDRYVNTLVATDADRIAVVDQGNLRRLTDVEIKRLFGFPDNFKLNEKFTRSTTFDLFGNSVIIPVVRAVAAHVYADYKPVTVPAVVVPVTTSRSASTKVSKAAGGNIGAAAAGLTVTAQRGIQAGLHGLRKLFKR